MAIWIYPPRMIKTELKHAHLIRDPASFDAFLYDTEKKLTNCKGSGPIYTSSKNMCQLQFVAILDINCNELHSPKVITIKRSSTNFYATWVEHLCATRRDHPQATAPARLLLCMSLM